MSKFTIIHPTRSRPLSAFKTYSKWRAFAENEIEYILSVDTDDEANYENVFDNCIILRLPNKSAIEAINNAAQIATGDLLIVISDDFDCQSNWDTKLLNHIKGRTDFCAKTIDGIQPTLITLPIMDRVYYERYGYVYHPDYRHLHADEELTCVAIMTGKYIKLPILFEHLHYSVGKSAKDAINDKNDATWAHGQATLDRRAKDNFGIENPVCKREDIQWR